jgi:hypothetical protein
MTEQTSESITSTDQAPALQKSVDEAVAAREIELQARFDEKLSELNTSFETAVAARAAELTANASVGLYDPVAAEASAAARQAALDEEEATKAA